MRKVILLLNLFIIGYKGQAQETFIELEGEHVEKKIPTDNDFKTFGRYSRFYKYDPQIGYIIELSSDANVMEYTYGFIHKIEGFNIVSFETSVGLSFVKEIRSNKKGIGVIGKFVFVTKPHRDRAKWKVRTSVIVSNSKFGWWYQAYATISPLKWVSIGFQSQKYSTLVGWLVQVDLPVIKPFIVIDAHQGLIGIKYVKPNKMKKH